MCIFLVYITLLYENARFKKHKTFLRLKISKFSGFQQQSRMEQGRKIPSLQVMTYVDLRM